MFFVVLEVQNSGTPATLQTVYTVEAQAYSAYYSILASAAVSTIAYHAAYIIRDDGTMVESKVFDRRNQNVVID